MNTIALTCQDCGRRQMMSAPDQHRAWDRALAQGWARRGKDLVCLAENPARTEYRGSHKHA